MPTTSDPAAATGSNVPLPNNSKEKGKEKPGSNVTSPVVVPLSTTSSAGGIPIHPVVLCSTTPKQTAPNCLNYHENTLSASWRPSYGAQMPPDLSSSASLSIDPILSTDTHHPNGTPSHSEYQETEIYAFTSRGVSPSAIPDTLPWNHDSPPLLLPRLPEDTGMDNEGDITWSHGEEVYEENMPGYVGTEEQDTEHSSLMVVE